MGKSTISMAIFNSYVKLPGGSGKTYQFRGLTISDLTLSIGFAAFFAMQAAGK